MKKYNHTKERKVSIMELKRKNFALKRTETHEFVLTRPITLTPVCGQTTVTVETTGRFAMTTRHPAADDAERSPRYIELAHTVHAKLKLSRRGAFHKVEIRLPNTGMPREADFRLELAALFREFGRVLMIA